MTADDSAASQVGVLRDHRAPAALEIIPVTGLPEFDATTDLATVRAFIAERATAA